MKREKKAAREHQKMLDWLARNNKNVDVSTIETPVESGRETFPEVHLQGQAALAYWENGKIFVEKKCRTCGGIFASNYQHVDTCTMKCLKRAVEDLGLTWRPEKPLHERWGRTPPLLVPPEALIVLKEHREALEMEAQRPPESVPQSPQPMDDSPIDRDFSLPELESF
jgi:hypothetical protein